jgi:acetyl-CoA hydrolase
VIPEGFYYGIGINNALAIDFNGHVNISARDKNHYSGVGGGAAIVRGLARGGISYLCMKSTHKTPEGELRSSIFPFMPKGTPICYTGPDMCGGREGARSFLVTEHGMADLTGKSQAEFIKALISVADPQFQPFLERAAYNEYRIRI